MSNKEMVFWTGKMVKELERLYALYPVAKCAEIMQLRKSVVKSALNRYSIRCDRDAKFRKGHRSWNKGRKGISIGGGATQFKKGSSPHNTKQDGAVSLRSDGYKYIRVAKAKWVLLHRYLWEQEYGKLPKGMILVFKDKNPMNCSLDNLELITRAEHARRNYNKAKAVQSRKKRRMKDNVCNACSLEQWAVV